jgi:hypothetical protein
MDHSLQNSLVRLAAPFGGGMSSLQHIAIPLDLKRSVSRHLFWPNDFYYFPKLKTLTFMLGCAEKTWRGDPSIELRDMEEWFADGRQRTVLVAGYFMQLPHDGEGYAKTGQMSERWRDRCRRDIADLAKILERFAGPHRNLAVRVVAWKRNISR